MNGARRDALIFLILGSVIYISIGITLERNQYVTLADFRALYYPARCILNGCDPYNENSILQNARAEEGTLRWDTPAARKIETRFIYPPTTLSISVPVAMLGWHSASSLWLALTIGAYVFASFLIWNLAAEYAPILSGILIGFLLANSELFVLTGNIAGIAISLCAISIWCFIRERFVIAGVVCLAIALAAKPHDTGLVWLYFLLSGGIYRKRALQSLVTLAVLVAPFILWTSHVAPNWISELQYNLATFYSNGGINRPGIGSTGAHGLGMLVSLQAIISVFSDDPRIYNVGSYLLGGLLILVWAIISLRSASTKRNSFFALAAISAITMLPIYHRQMDAKLILIMTPACALLWTEGGRMGRLALAVNSAAFFIIGELPWAAFLSLIPHVSVRPNGVASWLLVILQIFPVPAILLLGGIFYLWIYIRRGNISKAALQGQYSEASSI